MNFFKNDGREGQVVEVEEIQTKGDLEQRSQTGTTLSVHAAGAGADHYDLYCVYSGCSGADLQLQILRPALPEKDTVHRPSELHRHPDQGPAVLALLLEDHPLGGSGRRVPVPNRLYPGAAAEP